MIEHMLTCTSSPAPQSQTVFIPQLSVPTTQHSRTAKPRSPLHICSTFKNEKLTGLLHQEAKSLPLSGHPQHGDEGTHATRLLELLDLISFRPPLMKISPRVLARCLHCESQMCWHGYGQRTLLSEPGDLGLNSQMKKCSFTSSSSD